MAKEKKKILRKHSSISTEYFLFITCWISWWLGIQWFRCVWLCGNIVFWSRNLKTAYYFLYRPLNFTKVIKNAWKQDHIKWPLLYLQGDPYRFAGTLLISYALMTGIFPMSKLHSFATIHSFLLRYITLSQVYWLRNGESSNFKVQNKNVWKRCILLVSQALIWIFWPILDLQLLLDF